MGGEVVLARVISGGQTGVDRGAIGAALNAGFPYGGFVPVGRKAEDGVVPAVFADMVERGDYVERTRANVEASDGTLILNSGPTLAGGTKLTRDAAEKAGTPCLVLDVSTLLVAMRVSQDPELRGDVVGPAAVDLLVRVLADQVVVWLASRWLGVQPIKTMNVAGPRESKAPGIEALAYALVGDVIGRRGA